MTANAGSSKADDRYPVKIMIANLISRKFPDEAISKICELRLYKRLIWNVNIFESVFNETISMPISINHI